ncbi:5-formyltetrahydrofolate cyclo-ligase [Tropicimonas marinistellae]|uniref:5-formyltetrahydrofolate cyclo-ligase n=1 Tax=Tropicimonas marinistellae TaxID=1739787 RepID=UPI000B15AD65|nr:5-formyltetrahydrofolate cyclo-ligase [Tropicimonas marinistellae]
MTAELAARKVAARKAAFLRRAEAHRRHSEAASAALVSSLAGLSGRIIAGYLPIRTEANPLPAMESLANANRLCVPVIDAPGQPLRFREWRPGCALTEGPFRVMVPSEGAWLVPELVIAPLVAFDDRLFRLGYGGGFYDRTLQSLRVDGPVQAVGFAYSAQRDPDLPLEPTDQPLDGLVTEAGAIPLAP